MQEFAGRRTQRGLRTGIFQQAKHKYQRLWGSNAPQDLTSMVRKKSTAAFPRGGMRPFRLTCASKACATSAFWHFSAAMLSQSASQAQE